MRFSLPTLALNRPVTTVMAVLTLIGLGAVAYYLMPVEFLLEVDFPVMSCWLSYPGAGPKEVETQVAIPAEGAFLTVPGIKSIRTHSHNGGCYVFMRFEWGTDMPLATAEVRDRIERLKLQLPSDVERIHLHRWSQSEWPILRVAMFRAEDQDEMARLARTEVRARLMRVDGVADVEISGKESEDVYVEFDKNALRRLNLGLYQVISTLRASSLDVAVGELVDGPTKYYVRAEGEIANADELEDMLVAPAGIRLKDVAEVSVHGASGASGFSMDGKRGVFIRVRKESEANTVATCEAVKEEIERLKKDPAFRGVETYIFDDQSEIIRMAISALFKAGRYGSLMALVVLFLFLRRVRATFLVALAIPASLVATLVYLFFAGKSLNLVSMASMIVSLGMLVDNSIVVIENIYRHHHIKKDPIENARAGASEVGLAITTATMTTIVVFIPVLYMESGEMSIYMKEFAAPVSVALLTSLILSQTVIPLAASRIIRNDLRNHRVTMYYLADRIAPLRLFRRIRGRLRLNEHMMTLYTRTLTFATRKRLATLLLLALLAGVTFFIPYRATGMRQLPDMDLRVVRILVSFDPNYGSERAVKTFERLEAAVNEMRDELGIQNVYVDYGSRGGQISSYLVQLDQLDEKTVHPYTTEEIKRIFAERLPEHVPGGKLRFGIPSAGVEDTASISMSIRGEDAEIVADYADRFKRLLKSLPEIIECTTDWESGEQEIQVRVDESLAERMGLNPTMIARTVNFALAGTRLPYLKKDGKETPVWARFQGTDRSTAEDLENLAILTPTGKLVSLNQLAKLEKAKGPRTLLREDGKSVTHVTVKVATENLSNVRKRIAAAIKTMALPRGYSIDMGMVLDELEENIQNFRSALVMALILIFLVMSALFESCLLPLSILTSVPLAFIGVYWSMYLTGTSMDTISLIGAILMCGVIVNNGIVIVDHINQLRTYHGLDREAAIVQGGRNRLRPVLMTAITTILGCLPLAIGTGSSQDVLNSMGRALVGGLTMGTLLTLIVVPVFYSIIDDFRLWMVNYFDNVAGLVQSRTQPTPALDRERP